MTFILSFRSQQLILMIREYGYMRFNRIFRYHYQAWPVADVALAPANLIMYAFNPVVHLQIINTLRALIK